MAITNYFAPAVGGGILMTICWLLGYYGFSFMWLSVLVVLAVLNSKMWRQRERRVLALQQAALREKEVVLAQLRDLPAWVQFPDTERVEWLNRVIFQIWPYLGEFTKNFIKEEVEPRIKSLLPGPFKSFAFESIDMGDIPLRVGGIKVYTENVGRDRIIMDMDVAYAGDCEFVVSIGAFKAGLRQMQFKGKLRAILKPLIPQPPFIGGISAFLLDEPTIDFDLTGLGELVELPGLLGAVRSVINSQVAAICVLPNEIVVPLTKETDIVKLYFPEPDGVVRVHILEAKNLEDRDMMLKGKSDPYARVSVGAQSHKTKTIDNSLDPVWDEYFEAVVDQASGQRVYIELYDEDVASADEFLGRIAIELAVVRNRVIMDEWFQLEGVKRGDIHLRLFWLELSTDPSDAGNQHTCEAHPSTNTPKSKGTKGKPAAAPTILSNALLMAYVDNVSKLPSIRKNMEPTPYLELSVGKHTQKTYPRPKTPNPIYQQKFIFFVNQIDSQILTVEAKDEATSGQSIGETKIAVRDLLKEDNLELYQHKFHLTFGPHGSPLIMTLRLRFLSNLSEATRLQQNKNPETQHRAFGVEAGTNQLVLPPLDLNGSNLVGDGSWRNATFSPGATTLSDGAKGNFATRVFSRLTRSNSFVNNKLRRRRKRVSVVPPAGGYGKVELSLNYLPDKMQLAVTVHGAENLVPANEEEVADPCVKVQMLKGGVAAFKQTTANVQNSLNPRFEETLTFQMAPEHVSQHVMVVDVKDATSYGIFAKKAVLGQLVYDLARLERKKISREWFQLTRPCYDFRGTSTPSLRA